MAALAEIELLDAGGDAVYGLSSSSSDDGLEADSLALDDASPPHSLANEQDKLGADPSPSASSSASSASTSWSLAQDKEEAESVAFEETPVLTPETHEAPSLDDDEDEAQTTPYPHIFAIGDAADVFGALPAGHNAWAQGEVAGRNMLRLIACSSSSSTSTADKRGSMGGEGEKRDEDEEGDEEGEDEELETYTPGPPAIKVSLGLVSLSFLYFSLLSLPSLPLPPCLLPLLLFLLPAGSLTPHTEKNNLPSQRRCRRHRRERAEGPERGGDVGGVWVRCRRRRWGGDV
jgi:hypothetical protein